MRPIALLALLCAAAIAPLGCGPKHHKPVPPRLGMPEISAGMEKLRPAVHRCYEKHKVEGHAQATVRIEADGRVSEVSLAGKFKGTPSGACVIAVVKTARFDRFKNGPIVIQYPLLLR
ncbi:MAG: hypothetical protein KC503_04730 [Myxococcales bacterium]|nr:hypothetical protein [Myxococcales bacterium]